MDDKKEKLTEALISNMGNISKACKSVGISRVTYYNWLNADSEFEESVSHINEYVMDEVENHLMTAIRSGNVTAQIFFFKNQSKA